MIALIGDKNSKRTKYFLKAADTLKIPVSLVEWNHINQLFDNSKLQRAAIKIDPPSYDLYGLTDVKKQMDRYQEQLERLACLEQMGVNFLNTPQAIWNVLDKRSCKAKMHTAGVPVTRVLAEQVESAEQLLEQMRKQHCHSVFLKPVLFSGAAGVTAFRFQERSGKMQAYTSCKLVQGQLVNTKKLYCMEDRDAIMELFSHLLKSDIMAERWHPKAAYQGKSYDLRVVYQFGHIAHVVVRTANGPITNLHLNNQAMELSKLPLDNKKMQEIEAVCGQAVAAIPGLTAAGIDILLDKNTGKPYIIEINGQGDLIYQDIYNDNRIYQEQAERLVCKQLT